MSIKRQEWVDWMKENKPIPQMTNTQARFADYILNDEKLVEMMSHPGDIESIFKNIAHYLKNRDYVRKK